MKLNHINLVVSDVADKQDAAVYPEAFHIGFMQDGIEAVNEVWSRLKNDGVVVEGEPRKIRDSYGFYFEFDSVMIEVGHYLK